MHLKSRRRELGLKENVHFLLLKYPQHMQIFSLKFKVQGDDAARSCWALFVHHVQLANEIHETGSRTRTQA